jgi:hypothetical protein
MCWASHRGSQPGLSEQQWGQKFPPVAVTSIIAIESCAQPTLEESMIAFTNTHRWSLPFQEAEAEKSKIIQVSQPVSGRLRILNLDPVVLQPMSTFGESSACQIPECLFLLPWMKVISKWRVSLRAGGQWHAEQVTVFLCSPEAKVLKGGLCCSFPWLQVWLCMYRGHWVPNRRKNKWKSEWIIFCSHILVSYRMGVGPNTSSKFTTSSPLQASLPGCSYETGWILTLCLLYSRDHILLQKPSLTLWPETFSLPYL